MAQQTIEKMAFGRKLPKSWFNALATTVFKNSCSVPELVAGRQQKSAPHQAGRRYCPFIIGGEEIRSTTIVHDGLFLVISHLKYFGNVLVHSSSISKSTAFLIFACSYKKTYGTFVSEDSIVTQLLQTLHSIALVWSTFLKEFAASFMQLVPPISSPVW